MQTLVGYKVDLKFNPLLDWKPMEGFENVCNMVIFSGLGEDASSGVLYFLKSFYLWVWYTKEQSIAVVKSAAD